MATPALIQSKIYYGYKQAALRLGLTFQQYRPSSAMMPIAPASLVGALPAAFVQDVAFSKPMKFGNAQWMALVDGSLVQVGDYFVGPVPGASRTLFIAAMQPMLPILAVECNRTLTFLRSGNETQQYGIGKYNGDVQATEDTLLSGWPASVLEHTRLTESSEKLPADTRSPMWKIMMPALPGITLEFNDIATDDLGRRYVISSAELTPLGWRITASQTEI